MSVCVCIRFNALSTSIVISGENKVAYYSVLDKTIYEIRDILVVVALNVLFIVLPHWGNMS